MSKRNLQVKPIRPEATKDFILAVWKEMFASKNIPGRLYQKNLPGVNIQTMKPDVELLLKMMPKNECCTGQMGTGMTTLLSSAFRERGIRQ